MSASEKLKALMDADERAKDPGWGYGMHRGEYLIVSAKPLASALPQILALVEDAEAAVKIDATSSYKSIYSAPTEMASPLRNSLAALEAKLP